MTSERARSIQPLKAINDMLHMLEAKPRGVNIDLNEKMLEANAFLVLVGGKPDYRYVRYIERTLQTGVQMCYVLALGDAWIEKAERVVEEVTEKRQLLTHFGKDLGTETFEDKEVPAVLHTLIRPQESVEV